MSIKSIIIVVAVVIADRFLKKRFPRFYRRIELPVAIISSLLVAVYCGFLVYAICDVLTSGVSNGDKVFFTIFMGVIISIYVAIVVLMWRKWLKERKSGK